MSRYAERRCRADSRTQRAGGEQCCLCWQGHVEGMPVSVAPANPSSSDTLLTGFI